MTDPQPEPWFTPIGFGRVWPCHPKGWAVVAAGLAVCALGVGLGLASLTYLHGPASFVCAATAIWGSLGVLWLWRPLILRHTPPRR